MTSVQEYLGIFTTGTITMTKIHARLNHLMGTILGKKLLNAFGDVFRYTKFIYGIYSGYYALDISNMPQAAWTGYNIYCWLTLTLDFSLDAPKIDFK
jgi:hypothetical protein